MRETSKMKTVSQAACLLATVMITAGSANADVFNVLDTSNHVTQPGPNPFAASVMSVHAFPSDQSNFAFASGGHIDDVFIDGDDTQYGYNSMSAIFTESMVRWDHTWDGTGTDGFGYSSALIQLFFTVDTASTLEISWDGTGAIPDATDSGIRTILYESEDLQSTGNFDNALFFNDSAHDLVSGSVLLDLEAGVEYGLLLHTDTFFQADPTLMGFAQARFVAVPTPGSLGVFGIGCFAMTRRRR